MVEKLGISFDPDGEKFKEKLGLELLLLFEKKGPISDEMKEALSLVNYSSFEDVLYCKPHFDQLFKRTGSLDKSFEGTPKEVRVSDKGYVNSKVSSLFAGTQDKCVACMKTVYPIEKVAVDGTSYHKACFKCSHGGSVISTSCYVAHEHRLYCKHHHYQLFKDKGNFSQLDKHEDAKGVTDNAVS